MRLAGCSLMRPRGGMRLALMGAAQALTAAHGAATLAEIAAAARAVEGGPARCGVPVATARVTLKNMLRGGDLQAVGRSKTAGTNRWRTLYATAELAAPEPCLAPVMGCAAAALHGVALAWAAA